VIDADLLQDLVNDRVPCDLRLYCRFIPGECSVDFCSQKYRSGWGHLFNARKIEDEMNAGRSRPIS
jgi:hypothetical protein